MELVEFFNNNTIALVVAGPSLIGFAYGVVTYTGKASDRRRTRPKWKINDPEPFWVSLVNFSALVATAVGVMLTLWGLCLLIESYPWHALAVFLTVITVCGVRSWYLDTQVNPK